MGFAAPNSCEEEEKKNIKHTRRSACASDELNTTDRPISEVNGHFHAPSALLPEMKYSEFIGWDHRWGPEVAKRISLPLRLRKYIHTYI
jgi:hypothetical protein